MPRTGSHLRVGTVTLAEPPAGAAPTDPRQLRPAGHAGGESPLPVTGPLPHT